ncbi:uncharacterized protein PV07_05086 [Cladophialophora immunda]|uniref:Uncharacterized protein n=1 Tax=Cladophialophora immunda TaxID=569365 RepID=A0A0D1ZMS1_9EURO|nr:uncharacterized protein PV07_05086 [Cladophialophora immunda]KIW29261.1 hypothetical protein PV07_05086 [Cladophialophora immunda]
MGRLPAATFWLAPVALQTWSSCPQEHRSKKTKAPTKKRKERRELKLSENHANKRSPLPNPPPRPPEPPTSPPDKRPEEPGGGGEGEGEVEAGGQGAAEPKVDTEAGVDAQDHNADKETETETETEADIESEKAKENKKSRHDTHSSNDHTDEQPLSKEESPESHRTDPSPAAKRDPSSAYKALIMDAWRFSSTGNRAESMFLASAWAVYFVYYFGYAFGRNVA